MLSSSAQNNGPVSHLAALVAEWRAEARPLFIADEVRLHDTTHGEIIAFVFVYTDTQTASRFADEASQIRAEMRLGDGERLFKGSDLYGGRQRARHDALRAYVENAIARCPCVVRVTTTSKTITRYTALAPGGIRRLSPDPTGTLAHLTGRELVPFMNMLKVAAGSQRLGAEQVDVLVDRSAQLGLAPLQLGIPEDDYAYLGPGTLNEQGDGSPAEFQSPCRFHLICPPKKSAFRDLSLLADAVAYRIRPKLGEWSDPLRSQDFIVDVIT